MLELLSTKECIFQVHRIMSFDKNIRAVKIMQLKERKSRKCKNSDFLPLCLCYICFDAIFYTCVIAAYREVPPLKEKILLPPLHPHHLVILCHWNHHSEGYSNKNKQELI